MKCRILKILAQNWSFFNTRYTYPSLVVAPMRHLLMCLKNISLAQGKTYHCQLHLTRWNFVIKHVKSVRFQQSKLSKVAKMKYNSISDVCSIIWICIQFGHTITRIWPKSPCKLHKSLFCHIFHNGCMALNLLWHACWFLAAYKTYTQSSKWE